MNDLVDIDQMDTEGLIEPGVITSYGGAVGMYYEAIANAATAGAIYTLGTAMMTDELQASRSDFAVPEDALQDNVLAGLPDGFEDLSLARIQAERARGALTRYPGEASTRYLGELFALEGYAHVLLAEGFCSGIPLTKVRYGEDIEYAAGSSTEQVLSAAVALFDSALHYGGDRTVTLARVGKGRALLGLGNYSAAAEAVASVPTTAEYRLEYGQSVNGELYYWSKLGTGDVNHWSVVNREGGNGLAWIAPTSPQQDPRVPVTTTVPVRQAKYPASGVTLQTAASGIEARLIEAEAQLQPADNPNGPWLTTLNALRATLGVNSGGTRILPDTTDPGTARGRIELLFRERAFWFYLTGHRQGDLRRMIRNYGTYGFSLETVYPQGLYVWQQSKFSLYGDVVTLAPPPNEAKLNPKYDGCFDRKP